MKHISTALALSAMLATPALAGSHGSHESGMHGHQAVADSVIAAQRAALAKNTKGKGFGPQSPRDIDSAAGNNTRIFSAAPAYTQMNRAISISTKTQSIKVVSLPFTLAMVMEKAIKVATVLIFHTTAMRS